MFNLQSRAHPAGDSQDAGSTSNQQPPQQANRRPFRVPARAQRSGSCGKTTNSGRSEKSPKAVVSDLKLVRRTEDLRQKTFFFCRARHILSSKDCARRRVSKATARRAALSRRQMWRIPCTEAVQFPAPDTAQILCAMGMAQADTFPAARQPSPVPPRCKSRGSLPQDPRRRKDGSWRRGGSTFLG